MDLMHRYVALRRRVLGVDELHMYDLHVPLVTQKDNRYSFEEAKQIVRRGLAPLGEDYLSFWMKDLDRAGLMCTKIREEEAVRIPGARTEHTRMCC